MYKVKVFISLKDGILNPEAVAVQGALHRLGYEEVKKLKMSRTIELLIEEREHIESRVKDFCEKLLVNTIVEDYSYEIKEVSK